MVFLRVGVALWAMMLIALVSMGTAAADDTEEPVDVAVFELTGDGVDEELLETFSAILRQEAQQHRGYSLANPAAMQRDEIALVVGCDPDEAECLRQMAEYVDGQVLIFGDVERQGSALKLGIDILETQAGQDPVRFERVIEASGDPVVSFRRNVEEIFSNLGDLAKTHLMVESPDDDLVIYLDDEEIGRGEVERRGLAPGHYQIRVGDGEERVWDDEVELTPGQLVEIRPEIDESESGQSEIEEEKSAMKVEDSAAVGQEAGDVDSGPAADDVAPKALAGVGVAALMGSGVMVLQARNAQSQLVAESNDGDITDERYRELSRRRDRYQYAQFALFGLGAAAMGLGVGWAIWDHGSSESNEEQVRLAPTPQGLVISGTW